MIITRSKMLTAETLRLRFGQAQNQLRAAESMLEVAQAALATLNTEAQAAGLAREREALEHPPVEVPPDRTERKVRVRVRESFAHEHLGIPHDGAKDDVLDLPCSFADALARAGRVERVNGATPLRRREAWR